MSVKRYEMKRNEESGFYVMPECENGFYVKHEDYASLEQKLAESQREFRAADATIENLQMKLEKLAAENAGLKGAHPQPFGPEMMKALDAYEKHQDETPETGMLDAFFILRDSIRVDTTATDAFLTEARTSGVRLVIDYHNERADALRDIDRNGAFRHESAALDALDVLMKIRKGVQS